MLLLILGLYEFASSTVIYVVVLWKVVFENLIRKFRN